MKKEQVHVGGIFVAKVSGQLAHVRIDSESQYGGWNATNVWTHRKVRIKSAQRLRREVRPDDPSGIVRYAGDGPPQDIDERLAAAPPSVVPYEERRARAERAQEQAATSAAESAEQSSDEPAEASADESIDIRPRYEPDHCATPGCPNAPGRVHIDRPLCQECWKRYCEGDPPNELSETPDDACRPDEEHKPQEQEIEMSKSKKTITKSTKPRTEKKPAAPKEAKAKKPAAEKPPKRVSAIDAAATVLQKAKKPMNCIDMIAAMGEQGLWKSPGGKTPHATLYSAILREIAKKGREARFKKTDRGQFESNG